MPPSVPISAVSVMIRDFTLLRCLRLQKNHPPIAKASTRTPATAIPAIAGPPRCLLLVAFSSVEGPLPSGERNVDALLLFPELKASESVMELESLSEPIDEALDAMSDDMPLIACVGDTVGEAIGVLVGPVDEAIDPSSNDVLVIGRAGVEVIPFAVGVVTVPITMVAISAVEVPSGTAMVVVPPSCRFTHDTQSENMC